MDTMPVLEFTRKALLMMTLHEGTFTAGQKHGEDTQLWKILSSLTPQQLPDGVYRGDAKFFLDNPVQLPLAAFQRMLRFISDDFGVTPTPGEHLTNSYLPRIIQMVADERATDLGTDQVELTPEALRLITPMTIDILRDLIVAAFGLEKYSAEEQTQLVQKIAEMVFKGILAEAFTVLPDERKAELEKLLEDSNSGPDKIMDYLQAYVDDFDNMIAVEVLRAKSDFMSALGAVEEANGGKPVTGTMPSAPLNPMPVPPPAPPTV